MSHRGNTSRRTLTQEEEHEYENYNSDDTDYIASQYGTAYDEADNDETVVEDTDMESAVDKLLVSTFEAFGQKVEQLNARVELLRGITENMDKKVDAMFKRFLKGHSSNSDVQTKQ